MPEDQFRQIVVKIAWERQFGRTDQWCRDSVVACGDDSRRILHAEIFVRQVAMIALTSEEPHPKGIAYKRIGAVTTEMTREEYERLFLKQLHASDRWETEPAAVTLDDLDHAEIGRALGDAVRRGRVSEPLSRDPLDLPPRPRPGQGECILNAGVVLFARSDRLLPDYPQCLVKLARFRGRTRGESIADERQQHGNAFALVRQARGVLPRTSAGRGAPGPDQHDPPRQAGNPGAGVAGGAGHASIRCLTGYKAGPRSSWC
jgi:hypothetical protein